MMHLLSDALKKQQTSLLYFLKKSLGLNKTFNNLTILDLQIHLCTVVDIFRQGVTKLFQQIEMNETLVFVKHTTWHTRALLNLSNKALFDREQRSNHGLKN